MQKNDLNKCKSKKGYLHFFKGLFALIFNENQMVQIALAIKI